MEQHIKPSNSRWSHLIVAFSLTKAAFDSSNYFLSTFEMAFLHPNELQRIGSCSSSSVRSVFEMAFLDANTERGLLKRKSDNDIGGDLRNKEMKKDIEGSMDKMRMLRVS